MKFIIKIFGILLILMGILLLIKPELFFAFWENNKGSMVVYVSAILMRLVIGILLIKSANESKYPELVNILGYVFVIAAVVFAATFTFLSHESFQSLITSIVTIAESFAPVMSLISMAFGGFLIHVFWKR